MSKKIKQFSDESSWEDIKKLLLDETEECIVEYQGKKIRFIIKPVPIKDIVKHIKEDTPDIEKILAIAVVEPKLTEDEWVRVPGQLRVLIFREVADKLGFVTEVTPENFFRGRGND